MKMINRHFTITAAITTKLTLCLFTSLLFSSLAHAQNEGRWYNVEVLIFKRLGAEALTQENWRNDVKLGYPDKFKYLQSGGSQNFSQLPSSSHKLGGYNYTLKKNENYQVLSHKAWKQQMQGEKQAPAIVVNGGRSIGSHKELEGYIKIHIARYLHIKTDLWLTDTKSLTETAVDNYNAEEWPSLPARPGTSASEVKSNAAVNLQSFDNNYKSTYPLATLRERRRMRSNELHYIDHPLMGVLIMITPIDNN